MKTYFLVSLIHILTGLAMAAIPADYYDSANTSSASALRQSLNDIITSGHDAVGYDAVWDAVKALDEDPNNMANVIMIYTGQSRSKSSQCGSVCNDSDAFTGNWNREHLWPQSSFDEKEPMKSDLHALRPSDGDVNTARSNKSFGVVVTPNYSAGGSEGNGYWEPRAEVRGDIARAMFYMDVRYEGEAELDLALNDTPDNSAGEQGILSTLLVWHEEDPVTPAEVARNIGVYDLQGNANPFVDHPEWVDIVYGIGPVTDEDSLTVFAMDLAPETAAAGEEIAMMSLHLSAESGEWDMDTISVSQMGSATDENVTVHFYRDADQSDTVSAGDVLIDSADFVSGTAVLDANDFRLRTTTVEFLLTLETNVFVQAGDTLQLQLNSGGLMHSPTGGSDFDPFFPPLVSETTTIGEPEGSDIIISEIMYNSDSPEPNTEWVEIYNAGDTSAVLTGWRLRDEDGQTGSFSTTLASKQAAVIIPEEVSEQEFEEAWGTGFQILPVSNWSTGLSGLANSPDAGNEILTLRTGNGDIIDEVNYDDSGDWPVDSGGPSIYLLPGNYNSTDNDSGSSWAASSVGVDGGRANTVTAVFTGNDVGSPGTVGQGPLDTQVWIVK